MTPCPPPTLNIQVSLATGFAAGVANGLTFQIKASEKSGNFGGQFNPAVTLALAMKGAMPWRRAVIFMFIQVLASLLAALLALLTSGRPCLEDNFHMMKQTMAPAAVRILLEVILLLFILLVPLWAYERGSMGVPVLVGFSYIATTLCGLPQLMDVPNLLRCLGLMLIGVRNWSMVWPAAISAIIAAPVAVLLDILSSREAPRELNGASSDSEDAEEHHAL
eukprot:Skav216205  [mRNA]  locus=scaffold238:142130:142792:- [translate_table: standard]